MTGRGAAHGAATVVNAMAAGRGAAFGLDYQVRARIEDAKATQVVSNGKPLDAPEARLGLECVQRVARAAGRQDEHVEVRVESQIPPMKGLKSSSAVSVAVIQAAAQHFGQTLTPQTVLEWAADAGLSSLTSRTGAYDDAAACLLGGLVFTDNATRTLLDRRRLPSDLVALVHVPGSSRATATYRTTDLTAIRPRATAAFEAAVAGDVPKAMRLNTRAYAPVFDVDATFVDEALAAGAWAAGLSGTGPAQVALVGKDHVDRFEGLPPFDVIQLWHGGDA